MNQLSSRAGGRAIARISDDGALLTIDPGHKFTASELWELSGMAIYAAQQLEGGYL
ncbi:hypothetical protein [Gordonia sp. (in: high G+C Gram-positive bacteria)]|uniref:hypothetical protein n=1 Tax=Gordonia sp. (in: high G+C Gram-positive bacteria) TaxID=84139 RepID=UPI003C786A36